MNHMKTILLPFYHLGLGGVQTKIIDLANELAKSNKYRVIVYLENKESFDRTDELDPRVKLLYCPSFGKQFVKRRFYYFLLYVIFRYQPFSIFVSLEKTTVFLLLAKKYLPFLPGKIVVNVDAYLKAEQIYVTDLIKNLYQTADVILAPSRAAERDFLSRLCLTSPPVTYLPNWIEVKENQLPKLRKTHEFIYAGRLTYQKNPQQLIKFMKKLRNVRHSVTLSIYGEGKLKPVLTYLVSRANLTSVIQFHPTSHNVQEKLAATKFLLLLSRYEGMPLIGLEAMKHGCIILGLNVPGVQDLIKDEETGFCKNSIEELLTAYLTLCEDEVRQAKMAAAAFQFLKEQFDQRRRSEVIELLTTTKK